jgi:hypothetical protein
LKPHHTALSTRVSDILPDQYGTTVLRVLPCNPYRLYAYWEHPEQVADSGARWFLRWYPGTTPPANDSSSIITTEIPPECREWYLDVPAGVPYTVELQRETGNGDKTTLLSGIHVVVTDTPGSSETGSATDAAGHTGRPPTGTPYPNTDHNDSANAGNTARIRRHPVPPQRLPSSWSPPGPPA